MKNCPNCSSELEDNFDLCWNCNYSFAENKVVEFEDTENKEKQKDIIHNKNNEINLFNTSYLFKSTHNSMG